MVSYKNHKIIKKDPLKGLLSETRKIYVHAAVSANATSVIQAVIPLIENAGIKNESLEVVVSRFFVIYVHDHDKVYMDDFHM